MTTTVRTVQPSPLASPLALALVINFIWINLSEVFRYFAFVMPMMREAFHTTPDVAPMNLSVFLIWGLWDAILVLAATLVPWMASQQFGNSLLRAVLYGSGVWMGIFVILWLGLFNMNLATSQILGVALPWAWVEMVVAALVVWWVTARPKAIQA